jgi:hypothetical protein
VDVASSSVVRRFVEKRDKAKPPFSLEQSAVLVVQHNSRARPCRRRGAPRWRSSRPGRR